jgi:hypothetical protein
VRRAKRHAPRVLSSCALRGSTKFAVWCVAPRALQFSFRFLILKIKKTRRLCPVYKTQNGYSGPQPSKLFSSISPLRITSLSSVAGMKSSEPLLVFESPIPHRSSSYSVYPKARQLYSQLSAQSYGYVGCCRVCCSEGSGFSPCTFNTIEY